MRKDKQNSKSRTYHSLLKEQSTSDANILDATDVKID